MYKKRIFTFLLLTLSTIIVIVVNLVICNNLLAQENFNSDIIKDFTDGTKKELNIGFRLQSYPISYVNPDSIPSDKSKSYYIGFCNIFSDKLFENLKIYLKNELQRDGRLSNSEINNKVDSLKLIRSDVNNFSQGGFIKRYDGVIRKRIDIECGANSIRHDLGEIEFSSPFLQSGISLLAKKENLEKIASDEKHLGKLKVGVVSGTTTYKWLLEEKGHNSTLPYSSRPEAISELINGSIDAYVSDYIILRGILERDRNLKDKYDVYPKYLRDQEYGLVIKKGQSKLKEIINETIKSPELSDEIKYLNNTYSNQNSENSALVPHIGFLYKIFSNPLHSFLLGISMSAFVLVATITPCREKISEVISGVWERARPDIVNWLYGLWQLLIRLLFKK
jgi:ABC-type amino acid transport substrate-binding protein